MAILICTQGDDPHVKSVSDFIKKMGGMPILFERYRRDHFISYQYLGGNFKATVKIGSDIYDIKNDFQSIWWRLKPIIASELQGGNGNQKEQLCMHEWKSALHSLEGFSNGAKWVNPLYAASQISKKPIQLALATKLDLPTPETVITNDSDELLNVMFSDNKRVIYKSLSSFITENKAIYTTEIDKNTILNNTDSVKIAPGIFQSLVEKSHELRVTVVGNEIFTAKIDSQQDPKTYVDWRLGDYDKMFSKGTLSRETSRKLLKFHKESNLIYAAYDFIVDKQGREIFLECNPSGQWLWLEDKPGLAISEAVAEQLVTLDRVC